jgi:nitroreductase
MRRFMLSITQAVLGRHSVRAFLPQQIDRDTIEEMLSIASRAPSGGNLQPWHVDVVAGAALDALKVSAKEKLGTGLETPEFHVYPPDISELHEGRRKQCGEDLYSSIGIARDDKPARWGQFLKNYELFGAPACLFFSIDRSFDRPQWAHLGMFIQTLILLAEERGLGTCPQESWAALHQTVSDFLKLPPQRMLYCGLAIGYEDKEAPINRFRTSRTPIDEFVRFHGI